MAKAIFVANTSWFLYNYRFSIARELQSRGIETLLCAPEDKYSRRLVEAGFQWMPLNLGRQSLAPWKEFRSLMTLANLYRQEQPDLINHFTIKPVVYGSLAARLAKVPAVVNDITGRGYTFLTREAKARLLHLLVLQLYRMAFRHPNHAVVFENETDHQDFRARNLLNTSKVYLIEGAGVDTDYFFPPPDKPPKDRPLVVMPSRMLWDKGAGVLVEAARRLRIQARIALVGEPDPGNPASIPESTLAAWNAEGIVEWWGFQEDMRQVYWDSDIVALPTMYGEGVPTALQEAAACGCALIATDIPGCRNVVHHNRTGLLVPANDPLALAEAIDQLAGDSALRDRLGAAGRTLVLERFTTEKVNNERLAVYRQLVRNFV